MDSNLTLHIGVIRHTHFSFPTGLTNFRKSATCTPARRDWDDYLILIPKNFHRNEPRNLIPITNKV